MTCHCVAGLALHAQASCYLGSGAGRVAFYSKRALLAASKTASTVR